MPCDDSSAFRDASLATYLDKIVLWTENEHYLLLYTEIAAANIRGRTHNTTINGLLLLCRLVSLGAEKYAPHHVRKSSVGI